MTESLGICWKLGPDHDVRADGRALRYPRDMVCIRPPRCVWATAATGPVGFVSVDVATALLPDGVRGRMSFAAANELPAVAAVIRGLRAATTALAKESLITALVTEVLARGLVRAEVRLDDEPRAVVRARELLEHALAAPPSLTALAAAVGANHFSLLRAFRRRFGVPPHAFVIRLRAERARAMLARGVELAEVAQLLGFADQSHMTRVFKRCYGITPAAYRRRA